MCVCFFPPSFFPRVIFGFPDHDKLKLQVALCPPFASAESVQIMYVFTLFNSARVDYDVLDSLIVKDRQGC